MQTDPLTERVRAHRLYARLGFTHEGTVREATYREGEYVDVWVYGMVREDARVYLAPCGPSPDASPTI